MQKMESCKCEGANSVLTSADTAPTSSARAVFMSKLNWVQNVIVWLW